MLGSGSVSIESEDGLLLLEVISLFEIETFYIVLADHNEHSRQPSIHEAVGSVNPG